MDVGPAVPMAWRTRKEWHISARCISNLLGRTRSFFPMTGVGGMGSKMRRRLVAVCIIHLTAVGVFVRVHRGDQGYAVTNHVDDPAQVVRNQSSTTPPRSSSSLYFHHARPDRSGAVLEDMLLAHAHSFYNNLTYGGACATARDEPLPHRASHDQLIRLLGLQHILKFACPTTAAAVGENASSSFVSDRHDDPPMHRRFNTRIFRPEWLAVIRGEHIRHRTLVSPPPPLRQSGSRTDFVVIHIRRGDVSLCDPFTADRYLPNQHYVSLIESLLRNRTGGDGIVPLSIEVYSEEHSEPEGWEGLLQQVSPIVDHHRLSLHVNASASLAWSRMIQADVLVLSKSSFSFVPAIFAAAKEIIYTPFWLDPLPNWTIVDENLMQTTRRANLRLRHELCNHMGDGA